MRARTTSRLHQARGRETPRAGLGAWLRLAAAVAALIAVSCGLGWLSGRLPASRRMAQVIDERDLRATAIYYTDFEEPALGSAVIADSLEWGRIRGSSRSK